MSKRPNPVRTDDDSDSQKSNFTLLPEKMKTVYCRQKEIGDKQDLIFSLLRRVTQKVPNPNVQLELALVEDIIKENKTGLNQIEGIFDSHAMPSMPDNPPAVNDHNPVLPVEGNSYELGKRSPRDALQQAEQAIKHQRQQLALKESTASGDAPLMPSSGNIIQHEEHQVTSVSVVVGRENTTVNNSTVNILSIGEKAVDVDSPDFFEILKSLPLALQPSGNEEPALKQPKKERLPSSGDSAAIAIKRTRPPGNKEPALEKHKKEMLPSSVGTAGITTKRTTEHFRNTWQSQKRQHSTSAVQSQTVFQFLSRTVGKEWRDVGRVLGLRESTLDQIRADNSYDLRESVYQMLLRWQRENGSAATYNNLIRALLIVERKDLADEVFTTKEIMEEI